MRLFRSDFRSDFRYPARTGIAKMDPNQADSGLISDLIRGGGTRQPSDLPGPVLAVMTDMGARDVSQCVDRFPLGHRQGRDVKM